MYQWELETSQVRVVRFTKKHNYLAKVCAWWLCKYPAGINPDLLSEHGYMALFNEEPMVALFGYPVLNANIMWCGFPIANPDSDKASRDLALEGLFNKLHEDAANYGYKWVLTTSGLDHVQQRLLKYGYVVGDTGINQYWKQIEPKQQLDFDLEC